MKSVRPGNYGRLIPRTRVVLPIIKLFAWLVQDHEDEPGSLRFGVQSEPPCGSAVNAAHVVTQRSDIMPTAGSGHTACCTVSAPWTSLGQHRYDYTFHEAGGG